MGLDDCIMGLDDCIMGLDDCIMGLDDCIMGLDDCITREGYISSSDCCVDISEVLFTESRRSLISL